MLPSELRLTSLGHCYVHLPETFVSKRPAVKGGAVVLIKSLQDDHELLVMWNGQLTSGEHVELDYSFGHSNNFKDETVILSAIDYQEIGECKSCRVELVNPVDYTILSQHSENALLDNCKLISLGMTIPIFVSQHVKVLVKVIHIEPIGKEHALLSKWTELAIIHNLTDEKLDPLCAESEEKEEEDLATTDIDKQFLPFLSSAFKARSYNFNSMLICGARGSGKTYLINRILKARKSCAGEYHNCQDFGRKRPEILKKMLTEMISRIQEKDKQTFIIAFDNLHRFLSFDPKLAGEHGQEVSYKRRLISIFCYFIRQLYSENIKRISQGKTIFMIASSDSLESLDKKICMADGCVYFDEIIYLKAPNLNGRVEIIKSLFADDQQVECGLVSEEDFENVSRRCASFLPLDLKLLYGRAKLRAASRHVSDFEGSTIEIKLEDFIDSLEGFTPISLKEASLQSKTSLRTFDQIGGMREIKDTLKKMVLLPLRYPELFANTRPQNSVLLYGPPGCGKTMLAEAISNQDGINSICVRGPELLSKFIGASEAAIRNLFNRAKLAKPCVIFFDEFESLVAKRSSDSTGVTDRMVNQFLTILDGVDGFSREIFIVAASSRPDAIDPAVLRPGRLDKHIYCAMPDEQARLEILQIMSNDVELASDVDLVQWSRKLDKFSGADIRALICSAQLQAINEHLDSQDFDPIESGNSEIQVQVQTHHLETSFNEVAKDICSNYESLMEKYPPLINKFNRQRLATKATLA